LEARIPSPSTLDSRIIIQPHWPWRLRCCIVLPLALDCGSCWTGICHFWIPLYHTNYGQVSRSLLFVCKKLGTQLTIFSYACEIFTQNPAETAIILNVYRIGFGLSVAFYINPWVDLMGFNWTYGMMAIMQVVSFLFVLLLMWKGHEIREWKVGGLLKSEEGEHLIEEKYSKA
jgi:uncharacterized membrane protein